MCAHELLWNRIINVKKTWNLRIIIMLLGEIFTLALVDDLPLKFKRQQVSSSLQDFSQYSGRS